MVGGGRGEVALGGGGGAGAGCVATSAGSGNGCGSAVSGNVGPGGTPTVLGASAGLGSVGILKTFRPTKTRLPLTKAKRAAHAKKLVDFCSRFAPGVRRDDARAEPDQRPPWLLVIEVALLLAAGGPVTSAVPRIAIRSSDGEAFGPA
jgi:hypothetical protein